MSDALPEWAERLPKDIVDELRERGLLLPGGPGLQEVRPGVLAHPAPWGEKKGDDGQPGGSATRAGDTSRESD